MADEDTDPQHENLRAGDSEVVEREWGDAIDLILENGEIEILDNVAPKGVLPAQMASADADKVGIFNDDLVRDDIKDLSNDDILKLLGEEIAFSLVSVEHDVGGLDLESVVGWDGTDEKKDDGEFYEVSSGSDDLYSVDTYEEASRTSNRRAIGWHDNLQADNIAGSDGPKVDSNYDEGMAEDFIDVESLKGIFNPEERRGGRSMLEIAGFRDEDKEKERKRKMELFW